MSAAVLESPQSIILPSDGLFEIVDGEIVEKTVAARSAWIASRLNTEMDVFARGHRLGRSTAETLFRLNLPQDRNRIPDVAFVSFERCPPGQLPAPEENAWNVTPDLAVEVVSPSNNAEDLMDKIVEYFESGVRLVWVIYPQNTLIHVFHSLKSITVLGDGEVLDGGPVLPGFQIPVHNVFHEVV